VTAEAIPDRVFTGKVSFVWPVVEQATRTLQVRMDVENAAGTLRPGMFVNAKIQGSESVGGQGGYDAGMQGKGGAQVADWTCPMDPEVHSDHPGKCPICGTDLVLVRHAPAGSALTIPETAVIDTGTRKIVYLEREPGVFDAVAVKLGPRADGLYPVLEGLSPGDRVVTTGAFLVDAEGRLNPAVASTYFGASGRPEQAR
jgi:Cu(I)/Ag(I) efflux system membrane fusion protein